MASFNTIVRQMTEMFQWPKCLSKKLPKCLSEKKIRQANQEQRPMQMYQKQVIIRQIWHCWAQNFVKCK